MISTQLSLEDQHILIVDDNSNNLLLIQLILQEHNVKNIYKALCVKEAFEIIKNNSIDAILMDVMMPDVNGIQACKILKNNPKYSNIPLIMVTATDDNETFKESFAVGADDFIPKPINDVVLLSRLRSQLDRYQMYKTLVEQSRFSAMDEVISMLAHQWRQPLSVINAITNTLRTKIELDAIKPSELEVGFDKIEMNTDELSEMINTFKNSFSSSQEDTCTDIPYTLDEVCELHKIKIKELGITVNKEIQTITPVLLARHSLIQSIAHLLKNCFDSFERDPIDKPTITLSLKEENGKARIIIEDNGAGISKENMPHIYEPYFSTKIEKNGKGLGLYFAKQLATVQLNGSLHIVSKPGKTQASITITMGSLC